MLKSKISDKKKRREEILSALSLVGLKDASELYPTQLSGGMAQRAAVARAFVFPSEMLLMDEPFKGLDVALKKSIMNVFASLYAREEKTVAFVTHDPDEAVLLGDKIILLSDKPAAVTAEFFVGAPREERKLYDEELIKIKNEIYKMSENGDRKSTRLNSSHM